jgi:hypothetical protein
LVGWGEERRQRGRNRTREEGKGLCQRSTKLTLAARRTAVTRSLTSAEEHRWEHARYRISGGDLCILMVAA